MLTKRTILFFALLGLAFFFFLRVSPPSHPQKPQLVIYTYRSMVSKYGIGQELKRIFEERYSCHVRFETFETGMALFNHLRMEARYGIPKADVVLGIDGHLLEEASRTNLFEAPPSLTLPSFPLWKSWPHLVPFSYNYLVFIERSTRPSPLHFQSLEDFLNSPHVPPQSVILPHPCFSVCGLGFLTWSNKQLKNPRKTWKAFHKKILTTPKGWGEGLILFKRGEGRFFLSYLTTPSYCQSESRHIMTPLIFKKGNPLVFDTVGLLKTSTKKIWGQRLISILFSPEIQSRMLTKMGMFSVTLPFPQEFKSYRIKPILIHSIDRLTRTQWEKTWRQVIRNAPSE